jgi:hypothetical protein
MGVAHILWSDIQQGWKQKKLQKNNVFLFYVILVWLQRPSNQLSESS